MPLATVLLLFLTLLCGWALPANAGPVAVEPSVVAFVRVNVVPMDRERVLREQTVIVENGRIRAIGPGLAVPEHARVVDGGGTAWLSPGLADIHTHSDTRQDMAVYLANGVTTVLHMGEAPNAFIGGTRAAIERGDVPGPRVYAAFVIDGSQKYGHLAVRTPQQARALVEFAQTNGFDFIKVYNDLGAPAFDALIEEGRARNMPVVGHGVNAVGLRRQIEAGQVLIAHAEEFFYTEFFEPGEDVGTRAPDPQRIGATIALLEQKRPYVTADLATYGAVASQWGRPGVGQAYLRRSEARHLAPGERLDWSRRADQYAKRPGTLDERVKFLRGFVKAMADANLPLVTGTDAPVVPGVFPGYSVHENLAALEAAGLSRYQALQTATRTPGAFIGEHRPGSEPVGIVAAGYRADLVLAAGNPLDDLNTLKRPLGVMANGRWYPRSALQALTDQVAAEYARCAAP
jgi:imidazolonepropionase-like amidohydrolase